MPTSASDPTTAAWPKAAPYELSPRGERWIERTHSALDALAVVFLVAFMINWGFPDSPGPLNEIANAVAWLVWGAFAVDYVVRLSCALQRRAFVGHHKLDLLMVLLPMLRLLRVFLVLRRSLRSVSSDRIAGSIISLVALVIVVGAYLEWRVEYAAPGATITTFRYAVWWAIVTTTTVGYGDYTPVTPQGRLIASVLMIVGVGLIGTVSATVAAYFVKRPDQGAPDAGPASGNGASTDTGTDAETGVGTTAVTADDATTAALLARLDALAEEQREVRRILERMSSER